MRNTWAEQWAVLAADECERAERFLLQDARRRFVVARSALRTVLGRYVAEPPAKISLSYAPNGKPRLSDANFSADLQFNLAHSGELALIAVTRGCEVGVDVERLRVINHLQEIAKRYFHSREVAELIGLAPAERNAAFLRCWTGEEAVLKALGTGVTQSLGFFVGLNDRPDGAWIDVPRSDAASIARCWLQSLAPAADYVGAIACLGVQRRPRCFTLV
jgi:4'-phosphopantetheinyl transferase